MGRPPLALGTSGSVRAYRTASGWRARTRFRDWDGSVRDVERSGKTKGAAEQALRVALRDRARAAGDGEVTPETRVSVLAELWFRRLSESDRSVSTLQAYRHKLDRQILPALGSLRVRELTPGTIDRHLRTITAKHGLAAARTCRTILSGACGLATRLDALTSNPVRDIGTLSGTRRHPPRALSVEQVHQLRAFITYDDKAIARDLPDFVDFMLATGLRIGEAAAVTWGAIDLDRGTVEVRGTVIRVWGKGLLIKPAPKTRAGFRTLVLPSWCLRMLRVRASGFVRPDMPVFTAPMGGLRDPSNTQQDLREAFDFAGEQELTSHGLRRTVATLMDEAGLSARAAADQLGHTNPSMTQDRYMGRKVASTGAARVLESLG